MCWLSIRRLACPSCAASKAGNPTPHASTAFAANGFCEHAGALGPSASGSTQRERGQGTIGKALLTGAPAFSDSAASEPGSIGAAGLGELVAVPIVCDGPLVAVVAWHFQWIATRR